MWKDAFRQTLPFWILLAVLWFMAELIEQTMPILAPEDPPNRESAP